MKKKKKKKHDTPLVCSWAECDVASENNINISVILVKTEHMPVIFLCCKYRYNVKIKQKYKTMMIKKIYVIYLKEFKKINYK